ncbi:DUF2254 domain-containing protein [Granulosicoccus sp. 3-233]|uniref:DUF2254 domain-containing protein n=1 Tax=Granulosicoccus sp. 3-233 TaxID=3417969 RepID=UPI003D35771D
MHARLIKHLHDLRASYWFVPMYMVSVALILAIVMRWLDARHSMSWLADYMRLATDDASTILSTIATAILGVAGVTFSITMVAVSFASSNYGPRLINNFMRDKGSQYTLGTFIGTFVYSMTVMTGVHGSTTLESGREIAAFVPLLSICLALILAFASISVLIYFIHHITETINIENITASIGRSLELRITELFPQQSDSLPLTDAPDFDTAIRGKTLHEVKSLTIGYVQAIDLDNLNRIAEDRDLLVMIHYRPGDFTTTHDCLMSVWTSANAETDADELRECLVTGEERTEQQNVLFLVEQLSEVIARTLSPGINDPYTAISCMNWFRTALMQYLHQERQAKRENAATFPWHRTRVQLKPVDLDRLCKAMFDQTRQYVATDMNVTLHTMALLSECGWHAGPGSSREQLRDHLQRLYHCSCASRKDNGDTDLISQRFDEAQCIMDQRNDISHLRQETPWFGGSA